MIHKDDIKPELTDKVVEDVIIDFNKYSPETASKFTCTKCKTNQAQTWLLFYDKPGHNPEPVCYKCCSKYL